MIQGSQSLTGASDHIMSRYLLFQALIKLKAQKYTAAPLMLWMFLWVRFRDKNPSKFTLCLKLHFAIISRKIKFKYTKEATVYHALNILL